MLKVEEKERLSWPEVFHMFAEEDPTEDTLNYYHQAIAKLTFLLRKSKFEQDDSIRYLLSFFLEFNRYPKLSDDPLKDVEAFEIGSKLEDFLKKF